MNKKLRNKNLRKLAMRVGDFIRYWGFRRIHGEIWLIVYLADKPLSGIEIINRLRVSKSLVSPALKELVAEGLIKQVPSENSKVKRYAPVEDVVAVIKGVLRRREKPMLDQVWSSYHNLSESSLIDTEVSSKRIRRLGKMIQLAQVGLAYLLEFEIDVQK